MVGAVRLLACGQLALRAAFSASAVDLGLNCSDVNPLAQRVLNNSCNKSENITQSQPTSNVVASYAGFPKDMVKGTSKVLDTGVYGDDACFVSRFKNSFVVGVADGVGGWRKYGVDPSEFSSKLMKQCEERVVKGDFDPRFPEEILAKAFTATAESPRPVGSSTACLLIVHQEKLYSANLGDSGFMVVRDGKVLAKSTEQVHYFNAPFQLTLPPEGFRGFIGDTPDLADKKEISIKQGDIIVIATDGLWDNLTEKHVLDQLKPLTDQTITVQEACNALALTARRLAFDSNHNSPFAIKARENGFLAPGGKPDDITLVLLLIV
ncbi:unnamed protein product [Auanema sp. JU1783]|nr:unnamed protein product [Auanema sp. JU1783]